MTPKAIKKAVDSAWFVLDRICCKVGWLSRDCDSMLEKSTRAEREHRAMGKRWTNGKAAYRVSVDTAAKLISLQKVAEQLASRKKPDVLMCGAVRDDVVKAWYIAETLKGKKDRKLLRDLRAALKPVLDIDYAKDCAVR